MNAVRSWIPRVGTRVFDMGQNIAGWAKLQLSGSPGQTVVLRYGERLNNGGEVDQAHLGGFIKSGEAQTDRYTCSGAKAEVWEPRFTYHGFQYVQVEAPDQMLAQLDIQACVVQTDFEQVGMFECSNHMLNRLHQATLWSYRSNFVGIPTDCPHREKNGWTGDAHLAAEAGLLHFDASSAYAEWLESVVDAQRTNGQLPGIVPTAGWGFNWGSGPAWDSALLLIPWYIYLYTGNQRCIERYYPAMSRYVGYCASLASEGIVKFGLGDWCHPDSKRAAPAALTSTAYFYQNALLLARFARMTGRGDEALLYEQLALRTRAAFQQAFYKGDGIYAEGQATAQACALHHGLAEESDRPQVARQLAHAVDAHGAKADFGILGAKYVPRALAEAGYVELAFRLIVQPEYPGWMHWLGQGATTLWENWDGESSRNHVMFGDVAAWMVQYLGGIGADASTPGFTHFIFRPHFVSGLDWVKCSHRSPLGMIESHWQRIDDQVHLELRVPGNSSATLLLPDQKAMTLEAGIHRLNVSTKGTLSSTSECQQTV
ncbi:MAG: family 78 glycoside hydrolase catalytic domain [Phycisphaerales bacterium]|nr:family 78 glycoside hydrolase catalytic domain [Phycisphaerales bacterium]